MGTLHAIIAEQSLIRDKEARILGPDGRRQNWLFDLRKTFLNPVGLKLAAELFWDFFKDRLPFQVGGIELAAVPLIAAIQLEGLSRGVVINGFIVRRERKKYGLMKTYEGELTNDPVVVVDDTFNSANSFEKVRVVLAQEDRSIRDVFAVIDYENPAGRGWLARNNLQLRSLFTLGQFGVHQTRPRAATTAVEFAATWHFAESGGHYFDIEPCSAPALDNDRIYYGSDDGYLWALDTRTGSPRWRFALPGRGRKRIRSSPVIHDGRVYFGSYAGTVHCVTAEGGRELWRHGGADWIELSPSVAPALGMLFIGLEHSLSGRLGSIVALRAADGEKIWEFSIEGNVQASPIFDPHSQRLACGIADGELLLFDPVAARIDWRLRLPARVTSAVAFDRDRDAILVGTMRGSIHSISVPTGEVRWSAATTDAIHGPPLVWGNLVFVTSTDKHFYMINGENGKVLRRFPTRGKIFAPARLFDGRLYFGATSGIVYEVDPRSGVVTGQVQLPERITDAIAYDDQLGMFYARSFDGKIYAFSRSESSQLNLCP